MFKVLFWLNLKHKLDSVKFKEKVKVPFHLKFITNGMFKVLGNLQAGVNDIIRPLPKMQKCKMRKVLKLI